MGVKTRKPEKRHEGLLEILDCLVELTEKQKKLIDGTVSPDSTMAGKLERYIKAKAELIQRLEREVADLPPREAQTLAARKAEVMARLHEMETSNIRNLEKKINALGDDLLGINYSRRLKSAYSGAKSTPQPRFFDKKDN